ncbi:DUF4350 domain-containing protein [Hymenobacter jeongseonensis]|nr:DUF4350 domain-containing protein [Hymenobacter jeongseonensis]
MPQLTTFRLYLLGITLLFVGYVVLEYNRPKPLDWAPTYANKDKIPYGTYVLYDQLPRLLGTDSIAAVRLPVYSQLTGLRPDDETSTDAPVMTLDSTLTVDEGDAGVAEEEETNEEVADTVLVSTSQIGSEEQAEDESDEQQGVGDTDTLISEIPLRAGQANYLFVNQSFELSRPDSQALLEFVARGNDVFVAAQNFSGASNLLRKRLGFGVDDVELTTHKSAKGLPVPDSVELRFTNPALAGVRTWLPGARTEQRFVVDSGRVGRTLATDAKGRAVFIRLDYGQGHIYLCSMPIAFTNYYLLRPRTAGFATAALAYLPARRTWWDEYQKQGPAGEQSLLRVVFAHEALRQAYYLTLAGTLLFVLMAARRRQRIIPTINPLPNTTLQFTRTVASLYRQGSSHALIAEKKVGLFMDYLRTRFQETSPDFGDAEFRERLSQKAGVPRTRVDELLRIVNFARTAPQMSDQQLLLLSKALSDFKKEAS